MNRSVKRATAILEFIAGESSGRAAKEVAVGVGIPLPTAYHLLGSLVAVGLLVKTSSRRYVLGPKLGLLTEAFASQMRAPQHMLDRLQELATRTGETAYLSTWRDNDAVVVSIIEGRQAVRVSGLHLGYRSAAHLRATGKVLLAFGEAGTLDSYLATHDVESLDGAGSDDAVAELRADVERIRQVGYAVDEEQFTPGVACIAAPIADGSVAICVSAPVDRYRASYAELLAAVQSAASDATVTSLATQQTG